MAVTLAATSTNQSVQARSGTQYTAVNGFFTGVAVGTDIADLIDAGATLIISPEIAPVLPLVKGRFYGIPACATPAALLTVASTLYAYPVYIPQPITVQTLNLSVTTGQTGGAAHIGIYQDNGGYPGALVYDSGSQTGLTSTAVLTVTPATLPVLATGWYWIATAFSATGTYISVAGSGTTYTQTISSMLGSDTAAHALATSAENATGISVSFTYAALPFVFPTGAALVQNAAVPIVAIGV